jgi:hypothetical protein
VAKRHACSDQQNAAQGSVSDQPVLCLLPPLRSTVHGDPKDHCSGELLDEHELDAAQVEQQTLDLCATQITTFRFLLWIVSQTPVQCLFTPPNKSDD